MSSVHQPQAKKQLSLDRDHYSKAEQDKSRKTWRRKEKHLERAYRHKVKVKLDPVGNGEEEVAAVVRKKAKKYSVTPLLKLVKHKLSMRKRRIGSKIKRRASRLTPEERA